MATNEEMLLTALTTGTEITTKFQPMTNKEAYLAYLNGLSEFLPEPRTNEEALLYLLCISGGVGTSGKLRLNSAEYLFYNGCRLEAKEELLAALVSPIRADFMFYGCKDLKEVDISGIDWSKCTGMNNAFQSSGLVRIDLSGCNFASLIGGSTIFRFCNDLEEITGVCFPKYRIMDDFFPKGIASEPCKLRRLTFKQGVLSCGDINISYCSMERDGAVELFNSLSDYSKVTGNDLPVQNYRRITLIGNPCVTGEKTILVPQEEMMFTISEIYDAMRRNDIAEVTVVTDLDEEKTLTLEQADEQMFGDVEYLTDEEFPIQTTLMVKETVECETITDEDKAIATRKGWIIVEA